MKYKINKVVIVIDIVLMALFVALDQFTKQLAVKNLMNRDPFVLVDGVFEFRYLQNKGAAFGMLQDKQIAFLIIGGVFVALSFILLVYIPTNIKYFGIRIALVMISAGAIGNVIDRAILNYVIDFLYFSYIDFPIFNVADCFVSVGTALLILLVLFFYKDEELDFKKARADKKIHSSMVDSDEKMGE